jgi:electron transfer flavoprotein alpha subunit
MVLVLIEIENGNPTVVSLQMLTFGKKIAQKLGVPLEALAIGFEREPIEQQISRYGVSCLYSVVHPRFDEYSPTGWGKAICQVISSAGPHVVIAAATDRGNEVMAWVGALAGQPLATNCVGITPGSPFGLMRLRWGGSLLEESLLYGNPALMTVAPHIFEPEEVAESSEIVVETFTPAICDEDLKVRVKKTEITQTDAATLTNASVVIGGGRGVGSGDGFGVLEELAAILNGAVGGSRVATNNGWRPHSQQIGLTGNRISPELYIACGISGAIQHLVGCRGAKRILVINKDPEAPFFRYADYGVVGDLHEVVPALILEIKKRTSQ